MKVQTVDMSMVGELSTLFDAYRVFYRKEADPTGALAFIKNRLQKQDSVIYAAVSEKDKIVGFIQLYPSFSSTRMQRLWILNDLYILPEYRGQGISKLLINRSKKLCTETNACGLLLETEVNNHIGNRLYPACGFQLEKNNFYFWTNTSK